MHMKQVVQDRRQYIFFFYIHFLILSMVGGHGLVVVQLITPLWLVINQITKSNQTYGKETVFLASDSWTIYFVDLVGPCARLQMRA